VFLLVVAAEAYRAAPRVTDKGLSDVFRREGLWFHDPRPEGGRALEQR